MLTMPAWAEDCAAMGTGYTFSPATLDALVDTLSSAVRLYSEEPEAWRALQLRGMRSDFSWGHAASQYELLFAELLSKVQTPAEVGK